MDLIKQLHDNKAINMKKSYEILHNKFGIHKILDELDIRKLYCGQTIIHGKNKRKLCLYKSKDCNNHCRTHYKVTIKLRNKIIMKLLMVIINQLFIPQHHYLKILS